ARAQVSPASSPMDRNRSQRARHRGTEWRPMVSPLCRAAATKLDHDHGDGLEAVCTEAVKICSPSSAIPTFWSPQLRLHGLPRRSYNAGSPTRVLLRRDRWRFSFRWDMRWPRKDLLRVPCDRAYE